MAEYNLGTASGRIEVDGRAASVGFRVAETAAGAFFDVLKFRVQEVQQLGRRMAGVGAAGVAGFGLAIKTASEFEAQMSGVQAVVNGTEQDMEALRQKALELGADTVYSASEAALAIEELAKAGIPIEDILNGAAEGAVALAAAGGVGLAEAATYAANAMNQFGMRGDQVTEIADVLAGVANTSAADVSALGQSLSQAGAVANLAGLSFRDTAIALGEMADAGINGSDAGTSLKTMLNNLIPTTSKQSAKFKELGLLTFNLADANKTLQKEGLGTAKSVEEVEKKLGKYLETLGKGTYGTMRNADAVQRLLMEQGGLNNAFFDAQGNIKGLGGLQAALGDALKGMTRQQKLANLELLFGADAMRASAILSLAGEKGYRRFSKAVSETSAADVAATRLDNLSGAVEAFKGSMDTALITVGSVFIPMVTKIVQGATALVNIFNSLPGPVQKAIAIFGLVASSGLLIVGMFLALLPMIVGFIANMVALSILKSVIGSFKIFFTTLRAGTGVMAATSASATTLTGRLSALGARGLLASKMMIVLGRAVLFLGNMMKIAFLNPYVLALLALVAVAVLLYKRWEPFRNLVNQIASVIRDNLIAAWVALKPILLSALASLKEFGQFVASTLMPVLSAVGDMLLGKLLKGWQEISDEVMSRIVPAAKELASNFNGSVVPALQKTWKFIQPLISAFGEFAVFIGKYVVKAIVFLGRAFVEHVLPILIKVAGFLTGVLIDSIVGAVKGIIQAVEGIIQIFSGLIDFFFGVFTGDWSRAWDGIVQIFTGVWNLLVGLVKTYFYVGMIKLVAVGFNLLRAIVAAGWRGILALFRASGRLLLNIIKAPFRLIAALIRLQIRVWTTIFRTGWRIITSVVRGAVNFIRSFIRGVFNGIRSFLSGSTGSVRDMVKNAWDAIVTFTRTAWNRIIEAVKTKAKEMTDWLKGLPQRIKDAIGDLSNILYDIGKSIIEGLFNGLKASWEASKGWLSDRKDEIVGLKGPPKEDAIILIKNGELVMEGFLRGLKGGWRETEKFLNSATASLGEGIVANATVRSVIDDGTTMLATRATPLVAPDAGVRRRGRPTAGKNGKLRLVEGRLYLDASGRAFIRGVAEEVVDDKEYYDGFTNRRGPNR